MQLYGTIILSQFAAQYPDCRGQVAAWQLEVEEASWRNPQQLQERFATAQVSSGGQVVFRLLRGLYLLGTRVKYDMGIVIVQNAWADGHPEKAPGHKTSK